MGQQIIKQPNGKFAVFSSGSGQIETWDATEEELVGDFAEQAAESARRSVRKQIAALAAGEKPYYQFTMTWDEALESDREHDGEASATIRGED